MMTPLHPHPYPPTNDTTSQMMPTPHPEPQMIPTPHPEPKMITPPQRMIPIYLQRTLQNISVTNIETS